VCILGEFVSIGWDWGPSLVNVWGRSFLGDVTVTGELFTQMWCYWRAVYSDVVLGARGFHSGGVRGEGFHSGGVRDEGVSL
jgi:hypothetical protein